MSFAAYAGYLEAQKELWRYYIANKKYNSAVLFLKMATSQNDPESCAKLGIFYFKGRGTTQDYTQALYWLERALPEDGKDFFRQSSAKYYLALLYEHGYAGEQNHSKAFKLYEQTFKGRTRCTNMNIYSNVSQISL